MTYSPPASELFHFACPRVSSAAALSYRLLPRFSEADKR
jgi:hypothetical protein